LECLSLILTYPEWQELESLQSSRFHHTIVLAQFPFIFELVGHNECEQEHKQKHLAHFEKRFIHFVTMTVGCFLFCNTVFDTEETQNETDKILKMIFLFICYFPSITVLICVSTLFVIRKVKTSVICWEKVRANGNL